MRAARKHSSSFCPRLQPLLKKPSVCWTLSSRPCCLSSHTGKDFNVCLFFLQLPEHGRLCVQQWRHGAMVGWGNGWLNCILIYIQMQNMIRLFNSQLLYLMACIYTNTQTCTYTVHTVYLYTYCTHAHMHICMCLDNVWVRPPHCDQPVEAKWLLAGPKTV